MKSLKVLMTILGVSVLMLFSSQDAKAQTKKLKTSKDYQLEREARKNKRLGSPSSNSKKTNKSSSSSSKSKATTRKKK